MQPANVQNLVSRRQLMLVLAAMFWVVLATSALAEKPCKLSNNYCVPIVACTKDGGDFFAGRAYGKDGGPVLAVSKNGRECKGRWWRSAIGTGKAKMECSDGLRARISYNYFHKSSGTVLGKARLSDGSRMSFWAGHRIIPYVLQQEDYRTEMIDCVKEAL